MPFGSKLLVAALLGLGSGLAQGADLYVVCHADVTLSANDVRDMFLGEKQFSGTVKLLPADNSAAQALFLDRVLKMDAGRYSTAWTKKSFRDGENAPPVKGGDAAALEYVRHTPGACSYVMTPAPSDVVIVARL
jgi:hypothetical protein